MGWGEQRGMTTEERALHLADRLVAAVRAWEQSPTMNNQWKMLEACSAYETVGR